MKNFKVFNTENKISWCPGCGDYSILQALKEALFELDLQPNNTMIVSGIGQAAKTPQYVNANSFNSLHGRALPPALGIHMANPDLNIFVTSGDGDTYGEGGNHFIHNIRRNPNIVHLVYNNRIYGLTKGQSSPTTDLGMITSSQLDGHKTPPINPLTLALTLGAGFVARGYAHHRDHLKALIKAAYHYKGYAIIDIMQPCPSFNKKNTPEWYESNTYYLENHDEKDFNLAYNLATHVNEHIPLGILYRVEKNTFLERLDHIHTPLLKRQVQQKDLELLLDEFL
ncbi:MAG: 2-oxoacid:ferredoxin oxidoreductase subunit beta [Clostridia bacterium]|nr:2-oxoacid:ferredoxin oxidoreductase subunit beta [Clostridia bacterium]